MYCAVRTIWQLKKNQIGEKCVPSGDIIYIDVLNIIINPRTDFVRFKLTQSQICYFTGSLQPDGVTFDILNLLFEISKVYDIP